MRHQFQLLCARALLFLAAALSVALFVHSTPARSAELPPVNSPIFIQTNGPLANISLGDWYSSNQNGAGGGYHYLGVQIPCGWPAALDVHIDLYSPEINTFAPLPRIDENAGPTLSDTIFELYDQNTPLVGPAKPGPGDPGTIIQRRFTPIISQAERWVRFYTMPAPVTCGAYVLRAETEGDEQNGWRLRIGHDSDADPNNALPANYDNPDGKIGTGDELTVSIGQTTYQHTQAGQVACLLSYQYVRPNVPSVSFHNFDLDDNELVTYYPPSAIFDPQGTLTQGSIAGSVSGQTVWNGGTQTIRGNGDIVLNPEPGWWRLVTCVQNDNQFNQEGQTGVPIFREPVPEPDLGVTKDDGRTFVFAGDVLTYTIRITNQSLSTKQVPGAAFNVEVSDTLPANLSFRSCRLATAGLLGSCSASGQDVRFSLDLPLVAGATAELEVSATVLAGASGQLLNTVAVDYTDLLNNPGPTVRAEDLDLISTALPLPSVDIVKTARLVADKNSNGKADPSDRIEYTITVSNTGQVAVTNMVLRDTPDANTRLITGTVTTAPATGLVVAGNGVGDRDVLVQMGTIVPGASAQVIFVVQVNDQLPAGTQMIANQAIVRGDNVPDTPSDDPNTPDPDDPTKVPTGGSGGGPPTAISLTDFRAVASGDMVLVSWVTGSELNTESFEILRALSPDRAAAVSLAMRPARGVGGGGASYHFTDETLAPGLTGYYWLVEHEWGGATNAYGPIPSHVEAGPDRASSQIYIPVVVR